MDEDINDEFDIKNEKQFEDCELDIIVLKQLTLN